MILVAPSDEKYTMRGVIVASGRKDVSASPICSASAATDREESKKENRRKKKDRNYRSSRGIRSSQRKGWG